MNSSGIIEKQNMLKLTIARTSSAQLNDKFKKYKCLFKGKPP